MDISKINSNTNSVSTVKNDTLDKNAFLRILTVQLSNQDPANAKDNTEYIAQMAQFSALEQTQNLNVTLEKLLVSQKITEGTSYIGKTVDINLGETIAKEVVTGVRMEKGKVYIMTENGAVDIDNVIGVGETYLDK